MKISITYFYNVRFLKENQIPVSTAKWDPLWFHNGTHNPYECFIDKNNVVNGIKEETLCLPSKIYDALDEQCSRDCPYADKVPNCKFMLAYLKYLKTIDFNYVMSELERIAREVKQITHYKGEPEIVLLVHEKPDCKCAERPCLIEYFASHNIELKELVV